MAQNRVARCDNDALVPGRICRIGPAVNWAEIRDASHERKKRSANTARDSVGSAGVSSANINNNGSQQLKLSQDSSHAADDSRTSHAKSAETSPKRASSNEIPPAAMTQEKLKALLAEPALNLDAVKKLSWAGLPTSMRAPVWKILLGYLPTNLSRRHDTLQRRRREYREAVEQHYSPVYNSLEEDYSMEERTDTYNRVGNQEDTTMRQICIDIPRTCPGQPLFHIPEVQLALQRILYVWATRHPASGYVQGMNDLVTPFVYVFLSEYAKEGGEDSILEMTNLSCFEDGQAALANAEADAYWCLTALLNDIQDYYTFSQPGIQRRVHYLRELVARVDANLCAHLEDEGLDFLQFAFRWMNCLLMRELPFPLIVRVWDTYLAESDGFALFHVYVCAALLVSFSDELQEMDFQDLVLFLQNLPTQLWTSKEIDVVLSQAYMWKTIFGAAPSHLQ